MNEVNKVFAELQKKEIEKIINVVGYGSAGPGARIYINDELANRKEYYIGEIGEYELLRDVVTEISKKYDTNGHFCAIRDARREAILQYEEDAEEIHTQNKNTYYGYCMNGGGGRKEFRKMYKK